MAPKKPQPPARTASTPQPARRGPGRPKGANPSTPVTGFRIPLELLARLDAIAARRNAELASRGATTSRNAVMVNVLTEFCDREEAAEAAREASK
jgi:hypothetical protein